MKNNESAKICRHGKNEKAIYGIDEKLVYIKKLR